MLGYMGTFSMFQHNYGLSIRDVSLSPRLIHKLKDYVIASKTIMYDVLNDKLYDPWAVEH